MASRGVIAPESEHMGVVCREHDECVLGGRNVEGVLNDVVQNSDLLQCPSRIIVVVGVVYAPSCVRAGRLS